MQVHLEQLEQNIAQHNGQPICFNEYVYWFTWDVMGHFAFAESFGMLKNKSWHHAIHLLRKGLCMVGPLSPAPWLIRLAMEIPLLSVSRDFLRMENWCARQMDNRIKVRRPLAITCSLSDTRSAEAGNCRTRRKDFALHDSGSNLHQGL